MLLSNSTDLNPLVVKTHTAFQLSHEVNIRLTILSSVTWNPIVLSRQFCLSTSGEQVKHAPPSPFHYGIFGKPSLRRVHNYRDKFYNTLGLLTTVSGRCSPVPYHQANIICKSNDMCTFRESKPQYTIVYVIPQYCAQRRTFRDLHDTTYDFLRSYVS